MAYFSRRPNGAVYVQYHDATEDKIRTLPRKTTRHLDGEPDAVIQEWLQRWSQTHGILKVRPDLSPLPINWQKELDLYCEKLEAQEKDEKTIKEHRRHILAALPYFFDRQCQYWSDFTSVSRGLGPWLIDKYGKTPRRVYAINQSLRLFWKHLDNKGLVETDLKLTVGEKLTNKKTPLLVALKPEEVLKYNTERTDLKLFALLGYFFSLRPQEVIAIRPRDFKAGKEAAALECCLTLANAGLYGKLGVHIHRQRSGKRYKKPKQNSVGWVGCIDEKAAREIVKLLFGKPADDLLFNHQIDWYYKLWRKHGIDTATTKDLRRASLYHLGHYTTLGTATPVALKNHARHKHIETTMLYCRRPEDLTSDDWKAYSDPNLIETTLKLL